jgi:Ca2+-binding RTX toxin-like protein
VDTDGNGTISGTDYRIALTGNTVVPTGAGVAFNITGGSGVNTITGGAGADTISGLAGADNITGGEGADTITIGADQDIVSLTETTAAADNLIWATAFAAGNTNAATVTGFAFGAGVDTIDIQVNLSNGATAATSNLAAITPVAVGDNGTATADGVIYTFAGANDVMATSTLANAVANAVTVLLSGTDFSSANIATGDSLILQLNDGTNTFVFQYVADATANVTAAADLVLIGMFSGTTVAALIGDII